MTAATLTLTDFLLARIAEDEAVARDLVSRDVFAPTQGPDMARLWIDDEYASLVIGAGRALAECEAKRRVIGLHKEMPRGLNPLHISTPLCRCCGDDWPCPTLRATAAVYADHPDYRDEWRV